MLLVVTRFENTSASQFSWPTAVGCADELIVEAAPVFSAFYSGLFKSFDLLNQVALADRCGPRRRAARPGTGWCSTSHSGS